MVNERKHGDAKDLAKYIPTNVDFELALVRRMLLNQVTGLTTCEQGVDWVTLAFTLGKPVKDVTDELQPYLESVEVEGAILASKRGSSYTDHKRTRNSGIRIVMLNAGFHRGLQLAFKDCANETQVSQARRTSRSAHIYIYATSSNP